MINNAVGKHFVPVVGTCLFALFVCLEISTREAVWLMFFGLFILNLQERHWIRIEICFVMRLHSIRQLCLLTGAGSLAMKVLYVHSHNQNRCSVWIGPFMVEFATVSPRISLCSFSIMTMNPPTLFCSLDQCQTWMP